MNRILLFASFLIIFSHVLSAQNIDFPSLTAEKEDDDTSWMIKAFVQDEVKLWASPARDVGKHVCFWVPVIGATMISMANDEKIYANFKDFQSRHKWVDNLSPLLTKGGENYTVLSVSGLFYFGGMLFHNEKAKQTGILGVEALAHAGFIVTIGKLITGRQRPSYENGKDYWHWFPSSFNQFGSDPQPRYDAFPSGHSIAAWSLATVIAKQYKEYRIVPILAYTAAVGVGLSRITQDAHWMSDVIIGSALGYTIGSFIVRERKNTTWRLLPAPGGKGIMLNSVLKL
jgi:membrane-associated phospholipid phosphatase